MSVRFIIRKDGADAGLPWTIKDALCPKCESHDFIGEDWIYECTGNCDARDSFTAAIECAS